jgi:hypothetical protein
MGLFSSVLHIYQREQEEVVVALKNELKQHFSISAFEKIEGKGADFRQIIDKSAHARNGICYLITQPHGNWISIVEISVSLEDPFYLYSLTKGLSQQLNTYVLSFHLHDSDVLYYNLEKGGVALDGYNSDYQYFLNAPASKDEILIQRHSPQHFKDILPALKNVDQLNSILNEGYWDAFYNGDLDEDGVPNDDKYMIDEEDRFERVGKYLEIFSNTEYPFANWYHHLAKLNLSDGYLLKGES